MEGKKKIRLEDSRVGTKENAKLSQPRKWIQSQCQMQHRNSSDPEQSFPAPIYFWDNQYHGEKEIEIL